MTKDLINQRYEYAIRGRDEDEAVNHSLIEKLRADFGLILPDLADFEEEESDAIDLQGWFAAVDQAAKLVDPRWRVCNRSEEHTSELQSLMRISYAGFCLKKKKVEHTR